MVRILVADHHAILRAGLKEILVRDLLDRRSIRGGGTRVLCYVIARIWPETGGHHADRTILSAA
jgi:hypothetical protein